MVSLSSHSKWRRALAGFLHTHLQKRSLDQEHLPLTRFPPPLLPSRADRKEQLRSTQEIKQKKRSDNISKKLEDRKNARKGIKPKGDKKSFKKAGGPSGGSGGSKSRGGFEGKKGPGGGGGGGGGGKK